MQLLNAIPRTNDLLHKAMMGQSADFAIVKALLLNEAPSSPVSEVYPDGSALEVVPLSANDVGNLRIGVSGSKTISSAITFNRVLLVNAANVVLIILDIVEITSSSLLIETSLRTNSSAELRSL